MPQLLLGGSFASQLAKVIQHDHIEPPFERAGVRLHIGFDGGQVLSARVAPDALLGNPGDGWRQMTAALLGERSGTAWLGWATIFAVIELATLCALGAYFVNATLRKRPLQATAFLPFGSCIWPATSRVRLKKRVLVAAASP